MTEYRCGICYGLIREIEDGIDKVELGYDGCEEQSYYRNR